ncbi:MAG TPA: cation diffusion facilitator family transporter [Nitrososphaeraceae archaeon]
MEGQKQIVAERIRKLRIVLILIASYFVVQLIGGLAFGSLALIADAGHMLTDVAGISLSLLAIGFSRRPATPQRTYGFYRLEILATLANSVILISISVYIIYEAYQRIFQPVEVIGPSMLIIAVIGLAINLISLKVLSRSKIANHGRHEESLNMQSAFLEVYSDTLGSAGVIVVALIIIFTNIYLVDALASIAIAVFILPRTWSLMKRSVHILMEGVPPEISHDEVKKAIMQVKGVTGIFKLHIWTITSGINALSAHVVILDPAKSQAILREISALIENKFGISNITIQIETYHPEPSNI